MNIRVINTINFIRLIIDQLLFYSSAYIIAQISLEFVQQSTANSTANLPITKMIPPQFKFIKNNNQLNLSSPLWISLRIGTKIVYCFNNTIKSSSRQCKIANYHEENNNNKKQQKKWNSQRCIARYKHENQSSRGLPGDAQVKSNINI